MNYQQQLANVSSSIIAMSLCPSHIAKISSIVLLEFQSNSYMLDVSLTPLGVSYSNTSFTFSFSILILSGPITTSKNLTFYLLLIFLQFHIQIIFCQPFYYLFHFLVISLFFLCSHNYIVNETYHFLSIDQVIQDLVYHHLECCWRIG